MVKVRHRIRKWETIWSDPRPWEQLLESKRKAIKAATSPRTWVYLQRLGVIRDSLVILALTPIGNSPIVVGLSIPWVYLQRLGEVRDSLVILALLKIGNPTIVVGIRIISGVRLLYLDFLALILSRNASYRLRPNSLHVCLSFCILKSTF